MNTIDKILEEFDMPSKHQSVYFGVVIAVDDNNDCYINSGRTGYGGRIYPGEMNSILDSMKTTMVKVYSDRGTLIKKSELSNVKYCWLATHLESKDQARDFKRVLMGIITNPIMSRKYSNNFPMNLMAKNIIRVVEHKLHNVSGLNQIQLSIPNTIDRIDESSEPLPTPRQTDYSSEDMSHLITGDDSEIPDVDEVIVELDNPEIIVKNVYQAMPELDNIFNSVTIDNDRERNLLKQHINGWMADL